MGNIRKFLGKCILLLFVLGVLSSGMAVCASTGSAGNAAVEQVAQKTVSFRAESKWEQMDGNFRLALTTSSVPPEGVVVSMDVLVKSSGTPKFKGRMNIDPILLIGESHRWVKCDLSGQVRAINFKEKVKRNGADWYRTRVSVTFTGAVQTEVNGKWTSGVAYSQAVNQPVTGVEVAVAGTLCDYKGPLMIENLAFDYRVSTNDGVSVRSSVQRKATAPLSTQGTTLILEDSTRKEIPEVKLCDPSATYPAINMARYLAAVGSTDHVIFGHQDSAWQKAGTEPSPVNGLTDSDIEDITGSPAGVVGLDGLSLTGSAFSAEKWNRKFVPKGMASIDIAALGEPAANVKAAAALSNYCMDRGSIIMLSCHMPNFANVKERADYQAGKEPAYAKYDFTSSNARDVSARPEILPGGAHNAAFTAYLDMVADYASQVKGAVMLRLFHEGTSKWCWWGVSSYDAATYQKIYRYAVEYLRDTKQVHNLLYVYAPNAGDVKGAMAEYPGDDYVDIYAIDNYQSVPMEDSSKWFADFASELAELDKFTESHGKLLAVAEVGVSPLEPDVGDVATGFPRVNCPDRQWFEKLLNTVSASRVCFVVSWMNNEEIFYTPFVRAANADGTLCGHELLDDFIKFYNDRRSIFAQDQSAIVPIFR